MKRLFILVSAALALSPALLPAAEPAVPAHHVVVVVFDGMRPDFVSSANTPNLWKLAGEGTVFAHHHSVYLSSTEVNGTAIATGAYPGHSSVIANTDFRPEIDPQKPVDIQDPKVVAKGDKLSGGHYLNAPTLAEILHARGYGTAIAGSKDVAILHDRAPRENTPGVSPVVYAGETLPAAVADSLVQTLGAFPSVPKNTPKAQQDAWTARALVGTLWKNGIPPYSLLWLAEPDYTQHAEGPGSDQAITAIKNSDIQLGLVLAEIEKRGLSDTTDILVVSDHGFSTIGRKVDVATQLSIAGFASKRAALGGLKTGEVLVIGEGGSSLFYIGGHDANTRQRLVSYLQQQDWTGVIFSHEADKGTFPLAEAHIDSTQAPDLVVSYRWSQDKSANGTPGLHTSDLAESSPKKGNHASLSPFDMHNTLIAAGPDFRRGIVDTLPSANTDLTPTILWILGLKDEAAQLDGRVLGEALSGESPPLRSYDLKRITARRENADTTWTQYLQISEVNGVRYLDEGNGAVAGK
ncbi:MAG: alkaline phosphatase family protein [Verrucomicrobia bacterium]|nr:alkaline phosphatase family protein [Verrucomicrobiota bacterium]